MNLCLNTNECNSVTYFEEPTKCNFYDEIHLGSNKNKDYDIYTMNKEQLAKWLHDNYEEVAKDSDYKLAANWMIVELFSVLNKEGKEIKDSPVSAKNLSKLINLIKNNTISGKIAKTVFEEMVKNNEDPEKIVNEKGMKQQSDPEELKKIIHMKSIRKNILMIIKQNIQNLLNYRILFLIKT